MPCCFFQVHPTWSTYSTYPYIAHVNRCLLRVEVNHPMIRAYRGRTLTHIDVSRVCRGTAAVSQSSMNKRAKFMEVWVGGSYSHYRRRAVGGSGRHRSDRYCSVLSWNYPQNERINKCDLAVSKAAQLQRSDLLRSGGSTGNVGSPVPRPRSPQPTLTSPSL